jgi:1-acyl-sn-glycerol-3-phosphate acyltransferase
VKVLRDGGAVGIYPEGTRGPGDYTIFRRGAAYLAMVTGAPIVPVTMLGSRDPGGHRDSLPHRGAVIDMVYGTPFSTPHVPWPRRREQVDALALLLREHLLAQLAAAQELTGRSLPGPLPPGTPGAPPVAPPESRPDPDRVSDRDSDAGASRVLDQGAS